MYAAATMDQNQVTRLVQDAAGGDAGAIDRLLPLVYENLRSLADAMMHRAANQTLQPTALVHEAYLKLVDAAALDVRGREHFFALAATAMRQILIDRARHRGTAKRGGGRERVTLDAVDGEELARTVDFDALATALAELAEEDARAARVVELRFFAGLTNEEIARHLGLTDRTVRSDWRFARAWLAGRLADEPA